MISTDGKTKYQIVLAIEMLIPDGWKPEDYIKKVFTGTVVSIASIEKLEKK